MFYYTHNEYSVLVGKSPQALPDCWCSDLEFDVQKYQVTVAAVTPDNRITRWQMKPWDMVQENLSALNAAGEMARFREEVADQLPVFENEDRILKAQALASRESLQLLEDCIIEMAGQVYA